MRRLIVLLAVAVLCGTAFAGNTDKWTMVSHPGELDSTPAMTIWYNGSSGNAKIKMSADSIFFYKGTTGSEAGDAYVAEEEGDGILKMNQANLRTFGDIQDSVNRAPGWHCRLEVALRSDSCWITANKGAMVDDRTWYNVKNSPHTFYFDGDTARIGGIVISGRSTSGGDIEDEHGAINEFWYGKVNITFAAGTGLFNVYEVMHAAPLAAEYKRLLYSYTLTTATAATVYSANSLMGIPLRPITPGCHLVVRFQVITGANPVMTAITQANLFGRVIPSGAK